MVIRLIGHGVRFPIPEVPQGWKPDPRRVWHSDPKIDNTVAPAGESVLGKRKLTADQVMPGPPFIPFHG